MRCTFNLKTITFDNGYTFDFEYPIKETLAVDEVAIVTVDTPYQIVYSQNVFGFTFNGDFLWRIGEIQLYCTGTDCFYVGAILNNQNEVVLFNWCDTAVIVNPKTGDLIRTYQTK